MSTALNTSAVRSAFPSLRPSPSPIFFDNAGGSQTLGTVASSIRDYLEETNVQLGASYSVGQKSNEKYNEGLQAAARFMGADADEIVIGPSTTQLFTNLSLVLPHFPPGSEIVISRFDHEANVSPWVRLATLIQPHLTIKWWSPTDSDSKESPIEEGKDNHERLLLTPASLKPLLTDKTVMVTCTHTSNILGSIHDIQAIASLLQEIYASKPSKPFFCVDGVAYAPHRRVDMHGMFPGVDFYAFSWYKVYGPHIAVLYASRRAQQEGQLGSICHYFRSEGKPNGELDLDTRLGLAAASYELVASIPRVQEYVSSLSTTSGGDAWTAIAQHEESLAAVLLQYLRDHSSKYGITVLGSSQPNHALRVPVISFVVRGRDSQSVVRAVEEKTGGRIGCRWGHFYSKRLVDDVLGLGGEKGGVIRASMVHYNTVEEVQEFVRVLDEVLAERKG